jgi:hypothetical protein
MPTVCLTEAQRREAAAKTQSKRIMLILRRAMGFKTAKELALSLGMNDQAVSRRMRGAVPWDLQTLVALADALNLDDQSRAALMGSKTKCRWEDGFKV